MNSLRLLLCVIVGSLGLVLSAAAQPNPVADAARYVGADAIGSDGSRLGVVENLLLLADGQIVAAVVMTKVFLGLRECRMAIPWQKIKTGVDAKSVAVDMTRDEFNKLSEWESKNTPELRLLRP